MRLAEFRRMARSTETRAVILSDGCRDYIVVVQDINGNTSNVLTDRRKQTVRFRSIDHARRVVSAASEIQLSVRVAADEACTAPGSEGAPFAAMTLAKKPLQKSA